MRHVLCVIYTLIAWSAYATPDGGLTQPLVYSVSKLIIDKKSSSIKKEIDQTQDAGTQLHVPMQLILDVEVKDALNFYRQDGWINLSAMREGHAVLLAFEQLSQDPILPASNYAPMDILMVDEQGKITEIAPSLTLASLEQEIYPQKPVKAFVLMASGSTEKMGIKPGDEVVYSIFKKPPPVISESTPATVPTPEIPSRAITKVPDANAAPQKPNFKERRKPELQPAKATPQ
ncbi:MAG: DUF192 domain-containing protein [Alphaproteobacteria bacterium]